MDKSKLPPADEFDKALIERAEDYGVYLDERRRARLREYFLLVSAWNKRLHLVAPCSPTEFATRHVLESLLARPFISEGASIVDVGSGAGLPAIPCLIVCPDLKITLVEASTKKAVFLREALWKLDERRASSVLAERFEKLEPPEADYLTCRALERFTDVLPALVAWASRVPKLLLFGGESLSERFKDLGLRFGSMKVPDSERRFLFTVRRVPGRV